MDRMTDEMSAAGFGEWHIESLRVSVFHSGDHARPGLWGQVMGIPPESSDTRAREGIIQEQGVVDGDTLLLVIQRGRLDWNLLPGPDRSGDRKGLPSLMAVREAIPLLGRALYPTIDECGPVVRFALGCVLTQHAPDLLSGLKQLSMYLPRLDLENQGGPDFAFQINRRRTSIIAPHPQINRLARWQLDEIQGATFTVGHTRSPILETQRTLVGKLTLDINTIPGSNEFADASVPDLYNEFVVIARQIATQGDIP